VIASNAAGIKGVMRVTTGGRPLTASAWNAFGASKQVVVEVQGETTLLRFDSEPTGIGFRIVMK
jgi:hypothetical protein